jgi:S-adenosylmethionine:tRNA ribosyltransferase-isomerase
MNSGRNANNSQETSGLKEANHFGAFPPFWGLLLDSVTMRLDELNYYLPQAQIAQRPLDRRDASLLLVLDRLRSSREDRLFEQLPSLLQGDELLVLNNTRVIPARLFGRRAGVYSQPASRATRREHLQATVEVFLTHQLSPDTWDVLVRPGRKIRTGEKILFGEGALEAEVIARGELGMRSVRFVSHDAHTIEQHLELLGHVPLIAAPTAGLHFTPEILGKIRERGAEICELTLDVGFGTFQPIHGETLEGHKMHAESYEIPAETAHRIAAARAEGRRILAIGTTVVRALEDSAFRGAGSATNEKLLFAGPAEANLFIVPGFRFRVVDALLTNFHLPRSTLLALVCAFAGRENVLAAYRHAVEAGYRFYSYGDCMLIR